MGNCMTKLSDCWPKCPWNCPMVCPMGRCHVEPKDLSPTEEWANYERKQRRNEQFRRLERLWDSMSAGARDLVRRQGGDDHQCSLASRHPQTKICTICGSLFTGPDDLDKIWPEDDWQAYENTCVRDMPFTSSNM